MLLTDAHPPQLINSLGFLMNAFPGNFSHTSHYIHFEHSFMPIVELFSVFNLSAFSLVVKLPMEYSSWSILLHHPKSSPILISYYLRNCWFFPSSAGKSRGGHRSKWRSNLYFIYNFLFVFLLLWAYVASLVIFKGPITFSICVYSGINNHIIFFSVTWIFILRFYRWLY